VYRLTDELALVQTVDFFTPIVDEPELFGRIAVANALSDVYAMGGRPICAMNIVGFPVKQLDIELLQAALAGGLAKLHEAGVALAGGHSVDNPEFLYGLAVSGLVHPDRIRTNRGARAGDALVLTKALGTGIVSTALKAGSASPQAVARSVVSMEALNRTAAERMAAFEVHACTDVTGFGLIGHAAEMVEDGPVGFVFETGSLPVLDEALAYAQQGLLPGGLHRNRKHRQALVDLDPSIPATLADLVYDPQTSGGLLIALPAPQARELIEQLRADGLEDVALVGRVIGEASGRIRLV
jgi:selenide,water dikinase